MGVGCVSGWNLCVFVVIGIGDIWFILARCLVLLIIMVLKTSLVTVLW